MDAGARARLFVAVELPAAVREPLARWAGALAVDDASLRPVRSESLHVTLCFLGARPLREIETIGAACAAVVEAAGAPSLALATGSVLALGPRRSRAIAIAIEDPGGELARLQAALARSLAELGAYRPERRPFRAHVTLARASRGARGAGSRALPPPLRFRASAVTLYRSRPSAGGSVYEPLRTSGRLPAQGR